MNRKTPYSPQSAHPQPPASAPGTAPSAASARLCTCQSRINHAQRLIRNRRGDWQQERGSEVAHRAHQLRHAPVPQNASAAAPPLEHLLPSQRPKPNPCLRFALQTRPPCCIPNPPLLLHPKPSSHEHLFHGIKAKPCPKPKPCLSNLPTPCCISGPPHMSISSTVRMSSRVSNCRHR